MKLVPVMSEANLTSFQDTISTVLSKILRCFL